MNLSSHRERLLDRVAKREIVPQFEQAGTVPELWMTMVHPSLLACALRYVNSRFTREAAFRTESLTEVGRHLVSSNDSARQPIRKQGYTSAHVSETEALENTRPCISVFNGIPTCEDRRNLYRYL